MPSARKTGGGVPQRTKIKPEEEDRQEEGKKRPGEKDR
jgi:hypothetical protein